MFLNFSLSLAASSLSCFLRGFLAEIQLHLKAVEMGF